MPNKEAILQIFMERQLEHLVLHFCPGFSLHVFGQPSVKSDNEYFLLFIIKNTVAQTRQYLVGHCTKSKNS